MERTDQQKAAITAKGNVLVVAGAGTGKTSTLVERCLHLIGEGCSVDELLMVTFTEAAAAEMRHRLRESLGAEIHARREAGEDERAEYFDDQLALLDHAQISTLHSFCLELIRRHFHLLELDPQVRVLDDTQTRPMMYDVMERVMERHYDALGKDPVRELVRRSGSPSDDPIRKLVMKMYAYQQARANPNVWLEEQRTRFSKAEPEEWQDWVGPHVYEWAREWLPILLAQGGNPNAEQAAAALSELTAESTREEVAIVAGKILEVDLKWPSRKKTALRQAFGDLFPEAGFWCSICLTDPDGTDPLADDWENVRTDTLALLDLLAEFGAEYRSGKRELGGMDFPDLEQLALELLRDEDNGVAAGCRDRFEHVFVDEYQDINAAQDAIIVAVTRDAERGNRFLVGDIKQSIYRFRLAEPELFEGHAQRWNQAGIAGTVLPLSENFRSHESILAAVNSCFTELTSDTGIDYGEQEKLSVGARESRPTFLCANDPEELRRVEFRCLTEPEDKAMRDGPFDDSGTEDDLDKDAREARWIARRLTEFRKDGTQIIDRNTGSATSADWSDMVVLMRSPGPRTEAFAREFHRMGVPLQAKRPGFFDALEVMDQVNLLRILDNPRQDIPLLAVLRSALAGFTLEELAEIRHTKRGALFWDVLREFQHDRGEDEDPVIGSAWRKADEFLRRFQDWRDLVRHTSLTYSLEVVLETTHYERLLEGERRSPEKRANIERLLQLTRQFDPYQRQGLHRFLQFVDAQLEKGKDLDSAPAATANAVRLMSIHQSKGLEFPIVVLAGTGNEFNQRELREQVLFDERFGLCPKVNDPENETRYPSLPYWVAQRREKQFLLEEEMRLLYVAMTRARDYLVLTGGRKRTAEKLLPALAGKECVESPFKAGCMQDWLLDWIWTQTGSDLGNGIGATGLLRWEIGEVEPAGPAANVSKADELSELEPPLEEIEIERIERVLEWSYDWPESTKEVAKTNVSELRRRARDADETAVQRFGWSEFNAQPKKPTKQPSDRLTGTEMGNAYHAFLELVELTPGQTALDLKNAASQFREHGLLDDRQIQALDFDRLARFWYTEIGQWIAVHNQFVHRELPFTARFSKSELCDMGILPDGGAGEDDFVVVQGVVDLAVILKDEIRILDHKTDHFPVRALKQKIADYAPQLQLYAKALERIYRREVTSASLHFISLGKTAEVLDRD